MLFAYIKSSWLFCRGRTLKLKKRSWMTWEHCHSPRCLVYITIYIWGITVPRTGFARATLQVLRLRESGLLTAGLPCHSFIFLNRGTSKRSKTRPLGDQQKGYIQESNMLLAFIAKELYDLGFQ